MGGRGSPPPPNIFGGGPYRPGPLTNNFTGMPIFTAGMYANIRIYALELVTTTADNDKKLMTKKVINFFGPK